MQGCCLHDELDRPFMRGSTVVAAIVEVVVVVIVVFVVSFCGLPSTQVDDHTMWRLFQEIVGGGLFWVLESIFGWFEGDLGRKLKQMRREMQEHIRNKCRRLRTNP